jgi:predicted ArsR family transcriptional regulator
MESLVTATDRARWASDLQNEYRTIIELARTPVSLVEIGAALTVPVTVARVLVSDLVEGGYLDVHAPPPAFAGGRPSAAVLTRLLEGLRAR